MSFIDIINSMSPSGPSDSLTLIDCRAAVQKLVSQLNSRILGQEQVTRRIVQAAILRRHCLLEGNPGEGKTACVKEFAKCVGLFTRRVQFRPDMMPGDLIGKHRIVFVNGKARLRWRYGPIFAPVVIADEINRASPRVQAATLESMEERQVTRIDRSTPETVYTPEYRADLKRHLGQSWFGVSVPHPDDPSHVFYSVFATQNPLEMEGTYPLSEAQTDRFTFKVIVIPADPQYYREIVRVNLRDQAPAQSGQQADEQKAIASATGGPSEHGEESLPFWLKTVCLFDRIHDGLFIDEDGMHHKLLHEQYGLWDRVRLIIFMSHFRHRAPEDMPDSAMGSLDYLLRDEHQNRIHGFLQRWCDEEQDGCEVRRAARWLMRQPLFQYVQVGSSPRGLIDWPRAAIAEAFLNEDPVLRRKHFRAVADDVLRHRIRLTPQARADRIHTTDVIHLLVDKLLADASSDAEEVEENGQRLLPKDYIPPEEQ